MTQPVEQDELSALEAYILWRAVQHAEDQESIATALALALYPLWAIQRFDELDRTTPLWLSAALPVVRTAYLQSQRVTAVYAEDVRFAAEATADPLPMSLPQVELPSNVPVERFLSSIPSMSSVGLQTLGTEDGSTISFDEFPTDEVAVSLTIQGNSNIKAAMPGKQEELMYAGLANSSGAAIRQAMNGGRNATGNIVFQDRRVIGYARFTDGNPCWFCALLASRGAVFKKASFNTGNRVNPWTGALTKASDQFVAPEDPFPLPEEFTNVARVHDHCRCTLRPVYGSEKSFGDELEAHRDREAQFYYDQWEAVSRQYYWLSNKQIAQKFRQQYQQYDRTAPSRERVMNELEMRRDALSQSGFDPFSPQVQWAEGQLSALA